jgi:hypothetical protein
VPLEIHLNPPQNFGIAEAEAPIDPNDHSAGTKKIKILTFRDPQSGIGVHIPIEEKPAEEIGAVLLDRKIEVASAIPGPDGAPIDLTKGLEKSG